jgi:hypothetical protein
MSTLQLNIKQSGKFLAAQEVDARPVDEVAPDEGCPVLAPAPSVADAAAEPSSAASPEPTKKKNRCFVCKKSVGLLGFECKCGRLLCTSHRQAEEHQCEFDYRAEGKKRLADANPLVAFSKVNDI